jgi:hypothetical protein
MAHIFEKTKLAFIPKANWLFFVYNAFTNAQQHSSKNKPAALAQRAFL